MSFTTTQSPQSQPMVAAGSACLDLSRLKGYSPRLVLNDNGSYVISDVMMPLPVCNFKKPGLWHRLYKKQQFRASPAILNSVNSAHSKGNKKHLGAALVLSILAGGFTAYKLDFATTGSDSVAKLLASASNKSASALTPASANQPNSQNTAAVSTNGISVASNPPPIPTPLTQENSVQTALSTAGGISSSPIPLPVRANLLGDVAPKASSKANEPKEAAVNVVLETPTPLRVSPTNIALSTPSQTTEPTGNQQPKWVAVTVNEDRLVLRRAGDFVQVAVNSKLPTGETLLSINSDRGEYFTTNGKSTIQGY